MKGTGESYQGEYYWHYVQTDGNGNILDEYYEFSDDGQQKHMTPEEFEAWKADKDVYELPDSSITDSDEIEPSGIIVSEVCGNGYDSWQSAYANYIEQEIPHDVEWVYALIYLDNDGIPELCINVASGVGAELLLTYNNGSLMYLHLESPDYIERKGLIYADGGRQGEYPVYIYKLYQGNIYQQGEGIYVQNTDENGYLSHQYEWEGVRCSEAEFTDRINELFPIDDGKRPNEWYNRTEILSVLKTGQP